MSPPAIWVMRPRPQRISNIMAIVRSIRRGLVLGFAGRGVRLLAAAGSGGFLDGLFDRFTSLAGKLLNSAEQHFLFALDVLEIVVGELGPPLLQLAFSDIPVAFDFERVHVGSF